MPETATQSARPRRSPAFVVGVSAAVVALIALVAARATFGITPLDDGQYITIAMRLANGAVPFTDEATFQVLGFYLAVPFVKVWTAMFGDVYLMLAFRLYFVALATLVGAVVVWLLRRPFGVVRPLVGVAVALLALPYNIISVSYNTSAMLMLLVAAAFSFAAVRDASWPKAAVAGVFGALAAAAYPPFLFSVLLSAACVAIASRNWRVIAGLAAGGFGTAALVLAGLGSASSFAEIQRTLAYAREAAPAGSSAKKLATRIPIARIELTSASVWLAYALSVGASLPLGKRVRSWLALAIPFAAAIPSVMAFSGGTGPAALGVFGSSYLLVLSISLLLPVTVWAVTKREREFGTLLLVTGPSSLLAFGMMWWTSWSGFYFAIWMAGAAPLVVALLIGWMGIVEEGAGKVAALCGGAFAVVAMLVLLWGTTFKDAPPLQAEHRIGGGPLAGIATTSARARELELARKAAAKYVAPGDRLLVISGPLAYALADAVPTTNATWLVPGRSSHNTVEYFERRGVTPDAVFIAHSLIGRSGGLENLARKDVLVAWVAENYRRVDAGPYWDLFVRK